MLEVLINGQKESEKIQDLKKLPDSKGLDQGNDRYNVNESESNLVLKQ